MTNKLFDSFVSNKLQNYESPVPDGLWEKIMMKEEERKPVIFWWQNKSLLMLGLGVLLLLSTAGYLIVTKNSSKNIIASANAKSTKNNNGVNKLNGIITQDKTTANTNIKEEATNDKTENIINVVDDKNSTISKQKNNNVNSENKLENKKILHKNNNKNSLQNAEKGLINSEENTSLFARFIHKKNKNKSNTQSSGNSTTASFSAYNNDILNNSLSSKFSKANWEDIASRERNLINTSTNQLKSFSLAKLFGDDCPSTRGSYRNDFYVEGYISPDFAFKTVKSTKQGNEQYLSKKDSSESMRVGFTVGARFSKSISNNVLIKAGLQYSQFNEKLTLRTENDRKVTIVINSHTITRPGQPDTTINDTTTTVQIGYRLRTNINHYKNLELPVLVSYEFSEPQSLWKLAVSGGAIVNLTSWYEGKTIDSAYNLVNISSKSNSGIFKHQVGVSLYASLSVMRNITKDLDVFAEPYFRYGLSKSLQSSAGFTQTFNAFGIQFGARIKLSTNRHF